MNCESLKQLRVQKRPSKHRLKRLWRAAELRWVINNFISTLSFCVTAWPRPQTHHRPIRKQTLKFWDWLTVCVFDWQMWTSATEVAEDVSTSATTPGEVTTAGVVMVTGSRVTTRVWVSALGLYERMKLRFLGVFFFQETSGKCSCALLLISLRSKRDLWFFLSEGSKHFSVTTDQSELSIPKRLMCRFTDKLYNYNFQNCFGISQAALFHHKELVNVSSWQPDTLPADLQKHALRWKDLPRNASSKEQGSVRRFYRVLDRLDTGIKRNLLHLLFSQTSLLMLS